MNKLFTLCRSLCAAPRAPVSMVSEAGCFRTPAPQYNPESCHRKGARGFHAILHPLFGGMLLFFKYLCSTWNNSIFIYFSCV